MFEKHMPSGNDRAVSPVIGVVLMVGIVVALGAVVGAAVLGLGVGVGDTAPNAQFDATFSDDGDAITGLDNATIEHVAGDTVDGERLFLETDGADDTQLSGEFTAGTTENVEAGFTDGNEYDLRWESENGETSSVIATFEASE